MKAMKNTYHCEGQIYSHDLKLKVTGPNSKTPGVEFISGTLTVATDPERLNTVEFHFSYVVATTKNGGVNATFTNLKSIMDGVTKNFIDHGDEANYVRIDSALALNDFYPAGSEDLVSVIRNEGGFVHIIQPTDMAESADARNLFTTDMVITNVTTVEADPENDTPEKALVKGVIFDFRKAILPVTFSAINPGAIAYFEGLGASPNEPVATCLWGQEVSNTVVTTITTENAFGPALVTERRKVRKDFVITGANPVPYEFDTEDCITADELRKAIADRNVYLATVKQRADEYQASRGTAKPTATPVKAKSGDFNF